MASAWQTRRASVVRQLCVDRDTSETGATHVAKRSGLVMHAHVGKGRGMTRGVRSQGRGIHRQAHDVR